LPDDVKIFLDLSSVFSGYVAECKNPKNPHGILGNETLKDEGISFSKMSFFFLYMTPIEYHEKKIKIK
jgi:hypothetical protein